jgi:hypothetical protein
MLMKKLFSLLTLCLCFSLFTKAQSIAGSYEQKVISAPDEYKNSEDDVAITKDPKKSKKIWITGLIPNQKFYAVLNINGPASIIYVVPKQTVGNYEIEVGCIMFDPETDQVTISLNNKSNCFGLSQKDLEGGVSVGKKGVKAPGVKVDANGGVQAGGTEVSGGEVNVDLKKITAGINYVGVKVGSKKAATEN